MLRCLILSFVIGLATSPPDSVADQTFTSTSKNVGAEFAGELPRGDFDLRLRLTWTDPGSVVDTVGLNAAKIGSYALNVIPTEHVEFRVWDGSNWITIDSGQSVPKNVETAVRVVRRGGSVHFETGGALGPSKPVGVTLTQDRAYLGDFPGDQNWAPRANPNLGFIGKVTVEYAGPPSPLPTSVVHDPSGRLSGAETARLRAALDGLAGVGIPLAITFLTSEDTSAKGKVVWIDGDLQSSGLLPKGSGVLAFGTSSGWVYRRPSSLNSKLPVERIQEDWKKLASLPTQIERISQLLEGVLGTTKSTPTPVKTVTSGRVLARGPVGPEGGSVAVPGVVTIQFPPGAITTSDELIIAAGAPGVSGKPSLSVTLKGGYRDFAKPVTVEFSTPTGQPSSSYAPIQRLGANLWTPLAYEATPTSIKARTYHFTDVEIVEAGRLQNMITRSTHTLGVAAVGTAILISGSVGVPAILAGVTVCAIIGSTIGSLEYDRAVLRGLAGPLQIDGFDIFYDNSVLAPSGYALSTKDGYPIMKKSVGELPDIKRPLSGCDLVEFMREGQTVRVLEADIVVTTLPPQEILDLAMTLGQIRAWYEKFGLKTPDRIPVLVTAKINPKDFGNWDQKYLAVNVAFLGKKGDPASVESTLVHEYWHAIAYTQGYRGSYPGSEDSGAVGLESLVLAGMSDLQARGGSFITEYEWSLNWPSFAAGLLNNAPGQTDEQHGYHTYAWAKYLYHVKGATALRDFLTTGSTVSQMQANWYDFADHLFERSRVGKDPIEFKAITGETRYTYSGLREIKFTTSLSPDFAFGVNRRLTPNPLSLHSYLLGLETKSSGTGPGDVIVRRLVPQGIAKSQSELLMAHAGSAITGPRSLSGFGSIVIPEGWVKHLNCDFLIAVRDKVPTWEQNPMLVYRLAPPSSVDVGEMPLSKDQVKLTIKIGVPPLGISPVNPSTFLSGMRLFGRKRNGTTVPIADLLFVGAPPEGDSSSRYRGGTLPKADLLLAGPNLVGTIAIVPSLADQFDTFGVASIDAVLTVANGPKLSALTFAKPRQKVIPKVEKAKPKEQPPKGSRGLQLQLSGWGRYDGNFSLWGSNVWYNFALGSGSWPIKIGTGDTWSITTTAGGGGDKEQHQVEATQDATRIIELRWTCKGNGTRVENGKDRKFTFEWEIVLKDIPRDPSEPFVYRSTGIEDPNDHPEIVNPKTRACITKITHRIKVDDGRVITLTDIDMTKRGMKFGPFYTAPFIVVKFTYGN